LDKNVTNPLILKSIDMYKKPVRVGDMGAYLVGGYTRFIKPSSGALIFKRLDNKIIKFPWV